MNIIDCDQGSPEWLAVRAGKPTASGLAKVMSFLKRDGRSSAEREAYKAQIVSEILTGDTARRYVSPEMDWGTQTEPLARAEYETRMKLMVIPVGFVLHPSIDRAGASPDGLVGSNGLLEIKCPKTETHLDYMLAGVLPEAYEPQVMWQLACTGYEWCDFVSFDPRLPKRHQMFRIRVDRDEKRIAELEAGVIRFLAEVDEVIAKLDQLNPPVKEQLRHAVADIDDRGAEDFGDLGITDEDWEAMERRWDKQAAQQ